MVQENKNGQDEQAVEACIPAKCVILQVNHQKRIMDYLSGHNKNDSDLERSETVSERIESKNKDI